MKTVFEKGHKKAVIREGENFNKGKFVIDYYYDNKTDFEAMKKSYGIFDTLKQAQNNARYYINK